MSKLTKTMNLVLHFWGKVSDGTFLFLTVVFFIIFLKSYNLYAQVGINTTDPQQAMHIAHSDDWAPLGRMRVESLNSVNNSFNGGDQNGDGNDANDYYPLYVDENGDFTLEFTPTLNSGEFDALDDTALPTSTVYLPSTDINANESTDIVTYSITVPRASILEVRYAVSCDVYLNQSYDRITDGRARRIVTYFTVTGTTRGYAPVATCYSSGSNNSVSGSLYLSGSGYITLPSEGTYDITLVGVISSNKKANSASGDPAEETYVEFATAKDFVFMRLR